MTLDTEPSLVKDQFVLIFKIRTNWSLTGEWTEPSVGLDERGQARTACSEEMKSHGRGSFVRTGSRRVAGDSGRFRRFQDLHARQRVRSGTSAPATCSPGCRL